MSDDARAIMREMLNGFIKDRPDSDFQIGFLEGLVVFAHEGLGMRMDDAAFHEASDIAYASVLAPQLKRRTFQVIDGGKSVENGRDEKIDQ